MKKVFSLLAISILLVIAHQSLAAQEKVVADKLFHVEFFGPGVIMSANFDGRFQSGTRMGLGYRVGAGFGMGDFYSQGSFLIGNYYGDRDRRTVYSFPAGINYILGKPHKSSSFEIGGGLSILSRQVPVFSSDGDKTGRVLGYFAFMYRLMPVDGGMAFRAGFTPIIGTAGDLLPMIAIGFGYAF
jgi:hypothetical protein